MLSSRRRLLTGTWGASLLACAAMAAPAAAAEVDTGLEILPQKRDRTQIPACPFCQPGHPCPEHLV